MHAPSCISSFDLSISQILDSALAALRSAYQDDFKSTVDTYIRPYQEYPAIENLTPFVLPSVLVPPEIIEVDGLTADTSEESPPMRKEEWPEYYMRLFDDEVSFLWLYVFSATDGNDQITPNPTTPTGYAIRSLIRDVIVIFEVNRKDCARLLLELPKWVVPGTFKPRSNPDGSEVTMTGKEWQLENTVIEVCGHPDFPR
jgi:nuclear cap-binding protein subunit 1